MKINNKYIKDIKDNSMINNVRIIKNIMVPNKIVFVEFEPHSLDENIPSSLLLLTIGHRIRFNKEIKSAVCFVNNKTIKYKYVFPSCNGYNLITEKGDFIKINGVECETVALSKAMPSKLLDDDDDK
jgi:hypothetical protein